MKQLCRGVVCALLPLAFIAACNDDGTGTYTVPKKVVLEDARVNVSDMTVSLAAVYDGDDSGIEEAWFSVRENQDGAEAEKVPCSWAGGKAEARVGNLAKGKDYVYNFHILTVGGNTLSGSEEKLCQFHAPSGFVFSTQTTLTAKILQVAYSGADEFVKKAKLVMKRQDNTEVENVPEIICEDGLARVMFKLDEWAKDLYNCQLVLTLYDDSVVESQVAKLSLLPLPETLTLSKVVANDGKLSFSASYDGEDETIESAEYVLSDKAGKVLQKVAGKCVSRKCTAEVSGYEYGKYNLTLTLSLVDGSTLVAGPMVFVYSKPRTYEYVLMKPKEMSEAGMATSSGGCTTVNKVTYADVEWNYFQMYARTSSGKTTFYCSSSKPGWITNDTAFKYGVKALYIIHSSGKDAVNFNCYGKKKAEDKWTKMAVAEVGAVEGVANTNKYTFTYDLSVGDYDYFMFETTKQELKATYLAYEYYTEPAVEY